MQLMTIASEEARRAIAHSVMMAPIGSRVSIGPAIKRAIRKNCSMPC